MTLACRNLLGSRFYRFTSDIQNRERERVTKVMECFKMSKTEVIEMIMEINRTAKQDFLSQFSQAELDIYLEHLLEKDHRELSLVA